MGVISLIGVLALAAPAAAQATAAGIIGVITDTSAAVLPGVTVTVTGPALQVPSVVAVTDAKGEYRVSPLPPGAYTVTFELPGFQTVKRENVRLALGFTATLDQAMGLGTVQETVTVSGASPIVDVTNPATSVDMSSESLEVLPTNRDGLKAFMGTMPGVRTNLSVGASDLSDTVQFTAYGQSGQSWQMLDGIMFSTPNTGGANGSHVDFNALDSTRVQTVGSAAEMPRRGMMLDAVLKSGGNTFHGDAIFYGSKGSLETSNLTPALVARGIKNVGQLHGLWDYNGDLGGRIIKDKLWFFGDIRRSGFNRDILNAFNADGTAMQNNRIINYWAGKLSYQVNKDNKISAFAHKALELEHRGGSQFVPTEGRTVYKGPVALDGATWQTVHGNSLVASLSTGAFYQIAWYYAEPSFENFEAGNSDSPAVHKISTLDTFNSLTTGDATIDGQSLHRYRYPSKGAISYYRSNLLGGSHQFKAGFDYLNSGYNQAQRNKPAGNFDLRFNNGVPTQIISYNYPVAPKDFDHWLGLYGDDSWNISHRLNLALGLRWSHDNAFAPAQCHQATDFSAAQCFAKVQMPVWSTFSPRLHAAWDVLGDGKTVLKGGWGLFANLRDILPELTRVARNNSQTTTWTWHDLNGDKMYQPGEVNLDPNGSDFRSIAGVTNGIVNPNEPQPKSEEFSLSFERELRWNWGFRATTVYASNYDLRRLEEPLRPRSVYTIPITNQLPGNDGVVGTADDPGQSITYYEYPSALNGVAFAGTRDVAATGKQTYKTIEVQGTRRITHGWQAAASFSATKLNVPFNDEQADNPNSEINTANLTWQTTSKLSGGYTPSRSR